MTRLLDRAAQLFANAIYAADQALQRRHTRKALAYARAHRPRRLP